jgi:hypothetical protein
MEFKILEVNTVGRFSMVTALIVDTNETVFLFTEDFKPEVGDVISLIPTELGEPMAVEEIRLNKE